MKAKYLFGQISFIIICCLLVSFSFVREFVSNSDKAVTSNDGIEAVQEDIPANMVNVKILDCDDKLIYKTMVDLKDATRKKDDELIDYLKASEFLKKDQHTLFFKLTK